MSRKTRNTVGISLIALVFVLLVSTSIMNSYKYYHTVGEVIGKRVEFSGKDIKIAGNVKEGSVVRSSSESELSFVIEGDGGELAVEYTGQIPDTFREGIPVVVDGKLDGEKFTAGSLLTKCASRYEENLDKKKR